MMLRKRSLLHALFGLALSAACQCVAASEHQRPNIILFITDDQSPFTWDRGRVDSARAFGFNGENNVYTPEIDRLARDGIVFTRAYVSSSVCSPSRYTTLTGRYAGRSEGKRFSELHPKGTMTRVENNTELEEHKLNLAKVLQQNGYRTGLVGKSHIVDHDALNARNQWESKHGLKAYGKEDDPEDPEVTARMKYNHDQWSERIKKHGFDYAEGIYSANLRELNNEKANVHNVEWTTKAAIDFIKSSDGKPFFLYYATTTPHGPAPYIERNGKFPHGLDADPHMTGEGWVDNDYSFMPGRDEIKKDTVAHDVDVSEAWLRWIDSGIGAIRKQLELQGKLDNTLIIITSDHGAWRYGKTTLYEGGLRVPLAMHWPEGIKAGSTNDELVQNIDFAPTILDIAGIKPPDELALDGLSLKAALNGSQEALRNHLFAELGYSRAVFTKDWKYIAVRYDEETNEKIANGKLFNGFPKGKMIGAPYLTRNGHLGHFASLHNPLYFEADQLFHLSKDPKEEENLAPTETKTLLKMQALLKQELAKFPDRPFAEFTSTEELKPKSNLHVYLNKQWQGVCCSEGDLVLSNQACHWKEAGRVMATVDITNGTETALDCPENENKPVDCSCTSAGERMHGIRMDNVAVVNSLSLPDGAPIYPNAGQQTCIDRVGDEIEARLTSDSCPPWRLVDFYGTK